MTIEGYASKTSAAPGESISFCCSSAAAASATLVFERIGAGRMAQTLPLHVSPQPVPADRAWEGFGWVPTATFTVPTTWPSGLYRASAGGDWIADFVVRAVNPGAGAIKILLQVSFNTPNAYCGTGGRSFYWSEGPNQGTRAEKVSFDRPGIQIGYEISFIGWLVARGIPVEYCSSVDLHQSDTLLRHYNLLLSVGHDEYWSKEMRDHVEAFVKNGGNVAFFSGNTCYRQVRLEQNGRLLVFYKYASRDPLSGVDDDRVTVAFNQHPVCRPPNSLLGVGFADGGGRWYADVPGVYAIRAPTHWVFAGVGAGTLGDGLDLVGYEVDAAPLVEEPEGYPRPLAQQGTPRCFTPLATADMRVSWMAAGKPGAATMGLYIRNGTVFNAGTVAWAGALAGSGTSVDRVSKVTENVVRRLANRNAWTAWERIGHANAVCALTALDGKLYVATTDNRLWRRYPVGSDVPWKDIGHAHGVIALAGDREMLFAITNDNALWWRRPVEQDVDWTRIGSGVPGGTRALGATSGMLYATDAAGALWAAPLSASAPTWARAPLFAGVDATVRSLAGIDDVLFATTTDNRLLRTNNDFVFEATGWSPISHANSTVGLAAVDTMLFTVSTDNSLWWMDFLHLASP